MLVLVAISEVRLSGRFFAHTGSEASGMRGALGAAFSSYHINQKSDDYQKRGARGRCIVCMLHGSVLKTIVTALTNIKLKMMYENDDCRWREHGDRQVATQLC